MRAPLAMLYLATMLTPSPTMAQPTAMPLPPDSQARTVLVTSLLELLLALRIEPAAQPLEASPRVTPAGHPRDAVLAARRQDEVTAVSLTPP